MVYFRIITILGLATLLFNCSPKAATSLSKAEYQEWETRKKEMNPEQYKELVTSKEELATAKEKLDEQVSYLRESIEKKDNEIGRLTTQLAQVKEEADASTEQPAQEKEINWNSGTVFRVQLAAFDDYDLRDLTENGSDLKIIDEDGYIKYVLGQFRDYDMADKFKKKLRKLGVKEAWIVPYKDGKRVPLKEVLSEVIE